MKLSKSILSICFMTCCAISLSQNEHKIWYFGEQAGLDFNATPPTVLTNSAMNAPEGCSSIANTNGGLLFYTNGETIYNRNHQPMVNGTGLNGSASSAQSSLIVRQPESTTQYYVFTTAENGGANGFQYHIIDMTLDDGLGAVSLKNQLVATPISEKLTATLDVTGSNTWIVTHGLGNNSFYAYLLTPTGINLTPIVSNVGPIIQAPIDPTQNYFRGTMKVSPNGEYVCYGSGGDSSLNLFRFNNTTGEISDPLDITNYPTQPFKMAQNKFYGVEFSPNNNYLYMAGSYIPNSGGAIESQVWQFSLADYDAGLITFRATFLSSGFSDEIGGIQLAPNGKIYVAHNGRPYLSVIDDPDAAGSDATLNINAIDLLGRNSTLGLPNFTDINIDIDVFVDGFCSKGVTDYQVESNYDINEVLWDFGDGVSSDIQNPNHVYEFPGIYTVSVTIKTRIGSTTETFDIEIFESPIAYEPDDFIGCSIDQFVEFDLTGKIPEILNGQSGNDFGVSFHATEFDAEFDSFPLPELYTNQALQETIYVRIYNKDNPECIDITEFNIEVKLAPVLNEVNDVVLCDSDTDGAVTLDLTQFNNEILGRQDNTIFEVLFFENKDDAEDNINPLLNNYTNREPVEEVFFRIANRTSPECFGVGSFVISVFSASVVNQLEPVVVCDDNKDGLSEFQLGMYDELVLNGQSPNEFSVKYYASQLNAESGSDALDKTVYVNETAFQQTIYVRIQNLNVKDCYSISNFDLVINPLPEPDLQETYVICPGNEELVLDGGNFDAWIWEDENGNEIGNNQFLTISELGTYVLWVSKTAYGQTCINTITFEVLSSGAPESFSVTTNGFSNLVNLELEVVGVGEFEYSIDGKAFQNSNQFEVAPGKYTVFVRDLLLCKTISREIFVVGYPAFFSPNGDGINETWNIVVADSFSNGQLTIYNRYGKLLNQVSLNGDGWDGTYLGNPLPASDYWFRYTDAEGETATGHFALVR